MNIGFENTWLSIHAGWAHSLGIKTDGTLWGWGLNTPGELGDGTNVNRNSPIQIGSDNKWSNIAAGGIHTIGLKSDRQEFCATGYNAFGQLGLVILLTVTLLNVYPCVYNLPYLVLKISIRTMTQGFVKLL
ncbi:MAG: hypothetical protein IPL42_01445 [Saprospiraceae bacterium]|nr:hypothetical protein [Saprospiraceae bacterium]